MKFCLAAVLATIIAIPAFAQTSLDDMRAALQAVVAQRDNLANEQIGTAIANARAVASYEARLNTLIEWLREAQTKGK